MSHWLSEPDGSGTGPVRVVLWHPQRVWVDVLGTVLESREDVELVAAHTSTTWVSHAVATKQVDLALVHVEPPGRPIPELFPAIPAQQRMTRIVGLGRRPDVRLLVSVVRAGVRGWVEPTDSVERLVAILRGVARGETWLPRVLLTDVLDTLLTSEETREELSAALSSLSAREIDVLCCLAHGMSRQEIADRYVLSTHTVRTHINNLLRKLDVHSTLAAVSMARDGGLVDSRSSP